MTQREVLIFGASGYSGLELIRLLSRHPHVRLSAASASTIAGQKIREHVLEHNSELTFESHEKVLENARSGQAVLLATPAKVSADLAPKLLARGLDVVDLSGAFRLERTADFLEWYGFEHPAPELLARAHYGVPELFPLPATPGPKLIANPGCYATAAILASLPMLGLITPGTPLFIDGKSGATGAGKTLDEKLLFSELAESVRPYRIGKHQHTPEIERALRMASGKDTRISFTAHLIPMRRGLLTSVYAPAAPHVTAETVKHAYAEAYRGHRFLRVVDRPPETAMLTGNNFVEIHAAFDPRTHSISAFAALDNLVKGAAGQAIQNLNVILGVDPGSGLSGNNS
jgi:N-acetyl-gamma-glutamyl-phosphate reductase